MKRHARTLDAMEAALGTNAPETGAQPRSGPRRGTGSLPHDILTRFDGRWRGVWDGMRVEHRWRSLDAATQLVVLDDAGTRKRGINLVASDGTLCGVVLEPRGPRLHEGRYRPDLGVVDWVTADRLYRERVHGPPGRRRYEIHEYRRARGAAGRVVPGARAIYREVPPAGHEG